MLSPEAEAKQEPEQMQEAIEHIRGGESTPNQKGLATQIT